MLARGEVEVRPGLLVGWCSPLERQQARISASDAARVSAMAPGRRLSFLAGRALLAHLAGRLMPGAALEVAGEACPECGEPHGAPLVSGAAVTAGLAHSSGIVVAALGRSTVVARLGVDVEADRPDPWELVDLIGSGPEPALRRWTRIEAVLKADGRGLRVDPTAVSLDQEGAWVDDSLWKGPQRTPAEAHRYRCVDVPGPQGWLISLAWQEARAARSGRANR